MYGFHMTGPGVGIGPPTWEPGPANQNEFFLTKGQTELLLSTTPSSDGSAGEETGCGGPGLAWLHVL
jgi:hypothetical protein